MSLTSSLHDGFPAKFPLSEFLKSERAAKLGIPNIPTVDHERNLRALAWHVLHPLREALGGPIRISSGYRSPKLNDLTPGSSKTSQHSLGQAVDLVPAIGATFTTRAIFDYIRTYLPFDQLISEFPDAKGVPQWVHVSWRAEKRREQILVARKVGGKTEYAPWRAAA